MPATLTLKNIPDQLYDRLKLAAQVHRRSMNSEAIVRLEAALVPEKLSVQARLNRAATLRKNLPAGQFNLADIDQFKKSGRP